MGFTRSALLTNEVKEELRQAMKPLWIEGKTAKQIASILHFGEDIKVANPANPNEKRSNPYKNLKVHSVYLYRHEFCTSPKYNDKDYTKRDGGIPQGKPRYLNKRKEIMPPDEFITRLNLKCPKVTDPTALNYEYSCRKRAYLITSYWSPLRKSEILERIAKDFSIEEDKYKVNLYRKKKFHRENAEPEPYFFPLEVPMIQEVINWVDRFNPDEHPFNFSGWTARQYFIDVFGENFYPHFARFNFISKSVKNADNPGQLVNELIDDTKLDLQTVVKYVMSDPKNKASITKRELTKLKDKGIEVE